MIDIHSHLLTLENYPASVYFGRMEIPRNIADAVAEALMQDIPLLDIIDFIAGKYGYHIKEFLDLLDDNLGEEVTKLLNRMNGIVDKSVILLLDLEPSCGRMPGMPLALQIEAFRKAKKISGGKLIPFVNVDPRRPDMLRIVEECLVSDFSGIKLYPPLGYNPDPDKNKDRVTADNLDKLYQLCNSRNIPIIAHCSKGGIHGSKVTPEEANKLADPINWYEVCWNYPGLKIDLAHFGGSGEFVKFFNNRDIGNYGNTNWTYTIRGLMEEFESVYADIAFHDSAMDDTGHYFNALREALNDEFVGDRIMFGSDWPLTMVRYDLKDFVNKIEKELNSDYYYNTLTDLNPNSFLGL